MQRRLQTAINAYCYSSKKFAIFFVIIMIIINKCTWNFMKIGLESQGI